MKRLNIFFLTIIVAFTSGCSSWISNNDDSMATCLGDQCSSSGCIDQELLHAKGEMLDFCQPPAFGTFAIEKDGITWHFGESVSYGQFVNGDYWVLDKGEGVKVTKVSPGPTDGLNGSMINPNVGSQAYDSRIKYYDASKLVTFPTTLKAGESLVSTVSVSSTDLNSDGLVSPSWYYMARGMNPNHARIKNASVLTVVSEVPEAGSFRPPYIGAEKRIFNVSGINKALLKGYPAPSSLPDVKNLERGLERVWLMHIRGWTNREMHPVENMHNYYRDIGDFLSKASLVLLTDEVTPKLLNGYIQTGIDQYYTIKNGYGSRATYEFQTILTGLLLSDNDMVNVWAEGRSKTPGRVSSKFYYMKDRQNSITSSIVPEGQTWTGFNVGFANYNGQEHEHLHPSEWHKVVTEGGAKKTEVYRHCCNSIPWFGMGLASRGFKANGYWPNQAFNDYLDRWVWESKNGYGLEVIQQYYPSFYPELSGNGSRASLLGSEFLDDMYLTMGFSPNVSKPTGDPTLLPKPEPLPEPTVEQESASGSDSGSTSTDTPSTDPVISNQIEDARVIVEETSTTETSTSTVEDTSTTDTSRSATGDTSVAETSNQIEDTRVVTEETTATETTTRTAEEPVVEPVTRVVEEEPVVETTTRTVEEEPVVESTTSTVEEEPVAETTTRTVEEEPVVEATTRTVGEEPVFETTTRTVEEEPVVDTTASTVEETSTADTSSGTSGGASGLSTTSVSTVGETSASDTSTRTLDESSTDGTLVRTIDTVDETLTTVEESDSVDLSGGSTDTIVVEEAPLKEESIKVKRSNKIKDTRGLPPGRNK